MRKDDIEVLIEQTKVYNKRHAPKGSIYYVARCKHKGTLHTTAFLAKSAIMFKDDEVELRQHLKDQIRERALAHEKMKAEPKDQELYVLPMVIKYIKRQWKKINQN